MGSAERPPAPRKSTISVQRAWLVGEILGYLNVLRNEHGWADDPVLAKHVAAIEAMK